MYHFESRSRINTVHSFELALLRERWGRRLYVDPFYNPNLKELSRPGGIATTGTRTTRSWPILVTNTTQLDMPAYLEMNPDLAAEVERDPSWDIIGPLRGVGV